MQHLPSNIMVKLVRKRIDIDGLTKLPDQITSRMLQKDRAFQQEIQSLHERIRHLQKIVYRLIHINNNQVEKKIRKDLVFNKILFLLFRISLHV